VLQSVLLLKWQTAISTFISNYTKR